MRTSAWRALGRGWRETAERSLAVFKRTAQGARSRHDIGLGLSLVLRSDDKFGLRDSCGHFRAHAQVE